MTKDKTNWLRQATEGYTFMLNRTSKKELLKTILDAIEAKLPKDDIDEELSAKYDLTVPDGVHGFRVAIKAVKEALEQK